MFAQELSRTLPRLIVGVVLIALVLAAVAALCTWVTA